MNLHFELPAEIGMRSMFCHLRYIHLCLQQDLMDPVALKGETRPPKFMRCHNCGSRGHKAAECPSKDASHLGMYMNKQ